MIRTRRAAAVARCALGLAAAAAVLTPAHAYLKFGTEFENRRIGLKWDRMPVRFYLTTRNAAVPAGALKTAVDAAFSSWDSVGRAALSFENAGFVVTAPLEQDGMSTLGFDAMPELDRVLGTTALTIDDVTGEIVEADVAFNSSFQWSTASGGEVGRYDLESVALHEIGHLLGLGHSALGETELRAGGGRRLLGSASVMFPVAFAAGSVAGRGLHADDEAGIADIYSAPSFLDETGSIDGVATKHGRGVFGAHVVAFNSQRGELVGSFVLDDDGRFAIAGLEPGIYVVRVEPLDDADITSFFPRERQVDVDFRVTYLDRLAVVPRGGNAGPFLIEVLQK
ncbi:MAG: matrixin family metalloprotease [Acidobacteriota bacterium]